MAIKVQCGKCNTGFKAKDALAGRRVKCPKCKSPLTIGQMATAGVVKKQTAVAAATHNPLLDLLDEQEVRSVVRGPICENCAVEIQPGTIICIECGYNHETGEQLRTDAFDDADAIASDATMSDAERLMAKAEKDIEDVPITAEDQDFGDGSESILIAIVSGIIGLGMIIAGLVVIMSMEQLGELVTSSAISSVASLFLYFSMGAWITSVAFKVGPGHGIACIGSGGLYCIVFGFFQGKTMLIPTVIMLFALVIGISSIIYTAYYGWTPPREA